MFASNGINPQMINYVPNTSGFGQNSGGFGQNNFGGIQQLLSGLFSHSDRPYQKAGETLEDYLNQAKGYQNPFFNAGKGALPKFNEWLNSMKDPSGFINNLMGKYSESPWAKFQQEQALRAAGNMGSRGDTQAGGLGSTPMAQFEQQNARDISSQDMNTWLQNVLGINTQYGAGQKSMIDTGQHAGDIMSQLLQAFGGDIAKMRFGKESERNENRNNLWGGIFNVAKNGLFG